MNAGRGARGHFRTFTRGTELPLGARASGPTISGAERQITVRTLYSQTESAATFLVGMNFEILPHLIF